MRTITIIDIDKMDNDFVTEKYHAKNIIVRNLASSILILL